MKTFSIIILTILLTGDLLLFVMANATGHQLPGGTNATFLSVAAFLFVLILIIVYSPSSK